VAEVVKEPLDVELGDPAVTLGDVLSRLGECSLGATVGTKPKRAVLEHLFEQRADDLQRGLLHHPVAPPWECPPAETRRRAWRSPPA
jgi:hypothetical protein